MLLFLCSALAYCGALWRGWDAEGRVLPGGLKAHLLAPVTREKGALLGVSTGDGTNLEVQ